MIVRRIWPSTPRWSSPFDELTRMRREMESLFDALSGAPLSSRLGVGVFPAMNVTQDKDGFYVRAELPGVDPGSLEITALKNKLSVSGKREIADPGEGASYHRREREAGSFNRSLTLPAEFDAERVSASYTDGILTVTLPKTDAAKPRQISVKTS
jgi:HSP20 family protein